MYELFYCYVCSSLCILCTVCVQMSALLLSPGVNPIAVNKYITSCHIISCHIISHHVPERSSRHEKPTPQLYVHWLLFLPDSNRNWNLLRKSNENAKHLISRKSIRYDSRPSMWKETTTYVFVFSNWLADALQNLAYSSRRTHQTVNVVYANHRYLFYEHHETQTTVGRMQNFVILQGLTRSYGQ
jgi:hypothetical protein